MMTGLLIVHAQPQSIKTLEATAIPFVEAHDIDSIVAHYRQSPTTAILLELPDAEDGWELLQALEATLPPDMPPRIVLTQPEHFSAAIEAGADELLQHPLNAIALQNRLDSIAKQGTAILGILDVLAHDLNSPLGITEYSLQLLLEILDEMPDTETNEIYQLTENVLRSNYRLRFMIFNLLDYFRLQHGTIIIQHTTVEVFSLLRYVLDRMEPIAHENNIQLLLEADKDSPNIETDRQLLERIMIAALDTAIKFCQSSSVITVRAEASQEWLNIYIEDSGQPVQKDFDANAVFSLALTSQLRESGNRSSVGMSLPFIYLAIQTLGGKVNLKSDKNKTELLIQLPLPS